MAALTLDSVTVVRDGAEVLRDLSLHVSDGELMVILGPSGSGKSTLLRLIAGFERPRVGAVLFDGEPVAEVPTAERDVAMVFQDSVLYPSLTAGKNVGFPLKVRGVAKAEVEKRVASEARALAFERFMDRMPAELSAGHQQLVQVARAMVRKPEIFLMDEPLARLDAQLRTRMRGELRLLQAGYAVTTIYVTNDPVEGMAVADRIAVLGDGSIQQIGAPLDVYHRPNSRFVADLFGATPLSVLGAEVCRAGTGYRFAGHGWDLYAADDALAPNVGSAVDVGIRAEDVILDPVGPLHAEVSGIRHHGTYDEVDLRLGTERVVMRADPPGPPQGSAVQLRFRRYHVFAAQSGAAICHGG